MHYIKLGHIWEDHPRVLTTSEEVKDWFCSGGDDETEEHEAFRK